MWFEENKMVFDELSLTNSEKPRETSFRAPLFPKCFTEEYRRSKALPRNPSQHPLSCPLSCRSSSLPGLRIRSLCDYLQGLPKRLASQYKRLVEALEPAPRAFLWRMLGENFEVVRKRRRGLSPRDQMPGGDGHRFAPSLFPPKHLPFIVLAICLYSVDLIHNCPFVANVSTIVRYLRSS